MQTKEQWKKPKDWKVVTAVATASALGLSGLALAGPGDSPEPEAIDLMDRRSVDTVTGTSQVPTTVDQALSQVMDSVVSGDVSDASASVESVQSAQALGSPSPDSPLSAESPVTPSPDSPVSVDSPATPSPDSPEPAEESPDLPDSPDSPDESPDSPDSADSGSADS